MGFEVELTVTLLIIFLLFSDLNDWQRFGYVDFNNNALDSQPNTIDTTPENFRNNVPYQPVAAQSMLTKPSFTSTQPPGIGLVEPRIESTTAKQFILDAKDSFPRN